nr:hypothetical protein [Chloroflexota bacterium]
VQRLGEKNSHYDCHPPSTEQLAGYKELASTFKEITTLTLEKLDARAKEWERLVDRQDNALNLKLTTLAGIVVPATLVSSVFGQNIADSTGFPSWLVIGANVAALCLGGFLTRKLVKQKNIGKRHTSQLQTLRERAESGSPS